MSKVIRLNDEMMEDLGIVKNIVEYWMSDFVTFPNLNDTQALKWGLKLFIKMTQMREEEKKKEKQGNDDDRCIYMKNNKMMKKFVDAMKNEETK